MSGFASLGSMHLLCHDWMILKFRSYSYTPWILNLCAEYGKGPISTNLVPCTIFNTVQQHTYHSYHSNDKILIFKKIVHTVKTTTESTFLKVT